MIRPEPLTEDQAIQARAVKLIQPLLQPGSHDVVEKAVKRHNNALRELVRAATGLRLADDSRSMGVTVRVVDGFPMGVARLIGEYPDPVLWLLILMRPKLVAASEGLHALLDKWFMLEPWRDLPEVARGASPALAEAHDVTAALHGLARVAQVLQKLRLIDEDILGAYFYGLGSARIEIYWMAHALLAGAFGVGIEDLTVVTLSHELAHAYTHRGRDIDGRSWEDEAFSQSSRDIKEGLAQFYAAEVAERMREKAPGVEAAYRALLDHQAGPYLAHLTWFTSTAHRQLEIVRFSMLRARVLSRADGERWDQILRETEKTL